MVRLYLTKAVITGFTFEKDLDVRFPYKTNFSPSYELHTFLLYVSLLLVVHTGCPVDCQFIVYSMNIKEHFISLQEQIKNRSFKTIKELVIRHNELFELTRKMHAAFNLTVTVQCFISAVNICMIAFQILADNDLPTSLTYIVYLNSSIFELFVYCYGCQQIINEGDNVTTAIKQCPWYDLTLSEQKAMYLMLIRSQRNIKAKFIFFNAGNELFLNVRF